MEDEELTTEHLPADGNGNGIPGEPDDGVGPGDPDYVEPGTGIPLDEYLAEDEESDEPAEAGIGSEAGKVSLQAAFAYGCVKAGTYAGSVGGPVGSLAGGCVGAVAGALGVFLIEVTW